MGRTAEEPEIIELTERMQNGRLTASEAALLLLQARAIDELSEPPGACRGLCVSTPDKCFDSPALS
jgi:hypothetical protein